MPVNTLAKDSSSGLGFAKANGHEFLPNTEFFLEILGSQRNGNTALPWFLGLNQGDFEDLMNRHLSGIRRIGNIGLKTDSNQDLRQELMELRSDEKKEIKELLVEHRANIDLSELWLADILAAASLGSRHLWQDLGLSSRDQLKRLITQNFPSLARKNDRNMRWKKFIYKQLCEQGGHYVCRSPSCDICPTYDECFGEEQ